eukprot:COSAG02_NODE_3591_length_6516_cov_4.904161_2_plen_143_part_00
MHRCTGQVGGLDSVVNGATGGWERIVVRVAPAAIATLGGANKRHETRFGTASLSWRYAKGRLTMAVRVPIGSIAEVHSPLAVGGHRLKSVTEGARGSQLWAVAPTETLELAKDSDVQSVETRDSAIVTVVGSGAWSFAATYA